MASQPAKSREAHAAHRVLKAMVADIDRQIQNGAPLKAGSINLNGEITINGVLNLAMLADITERAIRMEFGL